MVAVIEQDSSAMREFRPGSQVYWWKRITPALEFPYHAEVVSLCPKRITISVQGPDDPDDCFIRHVAAEKLQPVGAYHVKAADQGPAILAPAANWGQFTVYLDIGEDLRALRQVNVFENGNTLCYDRVHWVDDFGMLGDARINRNRTRGPWGESEEIGTTEFERVWNTARASSIWPQQSATAQMAQMGAVPIWLTIKGWHPDRIM
jgi:hypothetical protein